jgi:hypothetical protein
MVRRAQGPFPAPSSHMEGTTEVRGSVSGREEWLDQLAADILLQLYPVSRTWPCLVRRGKRDENR